MRALCLSTIICFLGSAFPIDHATCARWLCVRAHYSSEFVEMNVLSSQIEKLIEERKFYQTMIFKLPNGKNKEYYGKLLSKNTRDLSINGVNIFDLDDRIRAEVEARGMRMADMPYLQKLSSVIRYWITSNKIAIVSLSILFILICIFTYINRKNDAYERLVACNSINRNLTSQTHLCRCVVDNTVYKYPVYYYIPLVGKHMTEGKILNSITERGIKFCIGKS